MNFTSGLLRSAQVLPDAGRGSVEVSILGQIDDFMICLTSVLRTSILNNDVGASRSPAKSGSGGAADAVAAVRECNSDCFVITIVTGEHELPGV